MDQSLREHFNKFYLANKPIIPYQRPEAQNEVGPRHSSTSFQNSLIPVIPDPLLLTPAVLTLNPILTQLQSAGAAGAGRIISLSMSMGSISPAFTKGCSLAPGTHTLTPLHVHPN